MKVFLVRHAIAHARNRARWPNDALRPLTPAGKRKFRKAARGLATALPTSAALLSSPFVRARQTAELLAAALGRKKIVETQNKIFFYPKLFDGIHFIPFLTCRRPCDQFLVSYLGLSLISKIIPWRINSNPSKNGRTLSMTVPVVAIL